LPTAITDWTTASRTSWQF